MAVYHSAYFGYGVHVPADRYMTQYQTDETDLLDRIIHEADTKGIVGHLLAGNYDRDELFLLCSDPGEHVEVALGNWRHVPRSTGRDPKLTEWDALLAKVIEAAGYGDLGEPGWIVVPDAS